MIEKTISVIDNI